MSIFRQYLTIVATVLFSTVGAAAPVWVEAESFFKKGGWVVDQQFIDCMGSSYLMAHGLGKPVSDASTTVEIYNPGTYAIYARTYNWTSPWSDSKGPGGFRIGVDGHELKKTLGDTGDHWEWQYAGKVKLREGKHTLTLHDLTGFNGRCDAIYLTDEQDVVLPDNGEDLTAKRRNMLGLDKKSSTVVNYDMVVVGGGIAGMCAAVSGARNGMKVALVNDRPVLGGNNSAEVRVHLGGYAEIGPNKGLGRMIREFGHSRKGNAKPAENYEDEKKQQFIEKEKNVTLYPCYRAVDVTTDGSHIESVRISNIETSEEVVLTAPLFCDCTGDGTIGYLAGADYAMGREGRYKYHESLAPEVADSLTMGVSIQWYSDDIGKPTKFPVFNFAPGFNDSTCQRVKMGEWTWETGMNRNQITEAERIRDYGLLVIFTNWSYLKNKATDNKKFRNRDLVWAGYISGKRESRRLLGDYILKQDDIDKNVFHEDASFTTTWSIDLHFADPKNSRQFPGNEFKAKTNHIFIHPYAVPYRCLYSRNIDNLFMAGRNVSVSHVALGTVRVMRTTGMMGEVVGMAASLCKKYRVSPRGVYQSHLTELTAMMQAGAGKDASILPDNQKFNLPKHLLEKARDLKE